MEIVSSEEWIIDGNYNSTMELRMSYCDTIIFLDYPTEVCLEGIMERRGTHRPDMPWADSDEPDREFVDSVKNYNSHNRPHVLERIEKYSDRDIYVFKSREEADSFLNNMKEKYC